MCEKGTLAHAFRFDVLSDPLRTITLEEHYATRAFMDGPGRDLRALSEAARLNPQLSARFANLEGQLIDVGEKRIADMDAAGIDVQLLSLNSPGT